MRLLLPSLLLTLSPTIPALQIATSLQWIEHTPQPYAISHFYNGTSHATLTSGGVANLASDPKSFDLAANAETQGLKQYATHRNLRLIYVICESSYRLVADKKKIIKLADLKGRKIGTFPGTSASVFIHNMLSSVGIADNAYTTVMGNVCMKSPCASDSLPAQLKAGTIDAFGIWEPAVELGIESLGVSNVVVFQNSSVYREVYALYSTTDALNDAGRRKDIVEFVRALNKTLDVFTNMPKEKGVYDYVAGKVGMDEAVVEKVWGVHKWSGTWGSDLIEYIVAEDKYLAGQDKRAVIPRKDLENLLDRSVLDEL